MLAQIKRFDTWGAGTMSDLARTGADSASFFASANTVSRKRILLECDRVMGQVDG